MKRTVLFALAACRPGEARDSAPVGSTRPTADTGATPCPSDRPDPIVELVGTEDDGVSLTFELTVTNWASYPDALFVPTDEYGWCGQNPRPARTWVDLVDDLGRYVYGYCALTGGSDLQSLKVSEPYADVPDALRVELQDRACDTTLASALVPLAR